MKKKITFVKLLTVVVVLLISNLVGQKICAVGPFRISGAQLLFPITYIFVVKLLHVISGKESI